MSQKNSSVGDVLTQLREYEVSAESHFVKEKAQLVKTYEKKHADLKKVTVEFEKRQNAQYELKLKDVKLLAKKSAKSEVAALSKEQSVKLTKAKKNITKAKELVLQNLV